MNKSDYNGVYEELVELLGLDNTLKIHKHFRGQQVNFPMRLYSKEYIEEYLIKNYNGKNLKELSKKLDYTTNWLRAFSLRILSKEKPNYNPPPATLKCQPTV